MPPTGDPAHNPGMCPNGELIWQHFGSQAGTQSTEPHLPKQIFFRKNDRVDKKKLKNVNRYFSCV